jgi:uncharacterized membrane protein YhhN
MTMAWVAFSGLLAAGLDWFALRTGRERLGKFTRPGVVFVLALGFFLASGAALTHPKMVWFLAGLGFSILGEALLNAKPERFLGGLAAYAGMHLSYIAVFIILPPFRQMDRPLAVLAVVMLAILIPLYVRLLRSLQANGHDAMIAPVSVYSLALSVMVYFALASSFIQHAHTPLSNYAVMAGALLFLGSDTVLAWNRFVIPLPGSQLPIRASFHLAQMCLTVGVLASV